MTVYRDRALKEVIMLNEITRVDPTLVGLVSSQEIGTQTYSAT